MKADQSVADFHDQIRLDAAKIEGITDLNMLDIFMNGLPKRLGEKVAEQDPPDLASALEKAKLFESVQTPYQDVAASEREKEENVSMADS